MITRHNPASHILAYTHGFAYICGCLSLSLFFNSDVDVFMRMAAFLYSTRISVWWYFGLPFCNLLSMQYFVNGEHYWKQYYEMGTVHIIICNPIGKKRSCTRIKFIADEQDGWEVSGGYWCKMIIPMSWLWEKMFLKTLLLCMYMDGIKFQICWKFLFWCGVIIKLKSSG